jgi:hypothetical protein
MGDTPSAAEVRAKLVARRAAAEDRWQETKRKQGEATQAREQARQALVTAEREGVDQATRRKAREGAH